MSIEQMRNQPVKGYQHPVSISSNRSKKYKTFTGGLKAKKNEKFGTVEVNNPYTRMRVKDEEENCPKCKGVNIQTCKCAYSDKVCANNHYWYTDREGNIKIGNPH